MEIVLLYDNALLSNQVREEISYRKFIYVFGLEEIKKQNIDLLIVFPWKIPDIPFDDRSVSYELANVMNVLPEQVVRVIACFSA